METTMIRSKSIRKPTAPRPTADAMNSSRALSLAQNSTCGAFGPPGGAAPSPTCLRMRRATSCSSPTSSTSSASAISSRGGALASKMALQVEHFTFLPRRRSGTFSCPPHSGQTTSSGMTAPPDGEQAPHAPSPAHVIR